MGACAHKYLKFKFKMADKEKWANWIKFKHRAEYDLYDMLFIQRKKENYICKTKSILL